VIYTLGQLQVVRILEDIRQTITDGRGNRKDLLFKPETGSGSLGFHYAPGNDDDPALQVQYMIAGGPAHISGQVRHKNWHLDRRSMQKFPAWSHHSCSHSSDGGDCQVKRGDVILRVDGIDLTDSTVEECFNSNKYIGSCSSMVLQREAKQVEVLLVRSSTEQLRSNQVLFGHLDALQKAISAEEDMSSIRARFHQLLA